MNSFTQLLKNVGPLRLVVFVTVTIGAFLMVGYISTKMTTPSMALLYSQLDPSDSSQIVSKLDAMNIKYELNSDGTAVFVPSDRVTKLRLTFAEDGVPTGGSVGYELFDKINAIGTTSFVQNVNKIRALEGELGRTISSIKTVASARVHLALPERTMFSRETAEASASVVLKLKGAGVLRQNEVAAIQHLIATAVPNLSPHRISIIDDRGNLLAKGDREEDVETMSVLNAEEMRRGYEQRLARNLEELLQKHVGYNKVRAEIRADMDFDRITENSEVFNPDGQVVRSTQTVEETGKEAGSASGEASIATNLPGAAGGAGASAGSENSRVEEVTNYEISKTIKQHVKEVGTVKKLSVAVLIDGTYELGENEERVYKPRTEEQIAQITTLVKSAIGFDEARGDVVEVVNLPFERPGEMYMDEPQSSFYFDLNKYDIFRIVELLVLGIVTLLVVFLVIRPLIRFMINPEKTEAAVQAIQNLLPGQTENSGNQLQIGTSAGLDAQTQQAIASKGSAIEKMIDINQVEGKVRESSLKKIGDLVENHPQETVSIIRNWISQDEVEAR